MILAERCIARIEFPEHQARGTGFLIGPDMLITNDHVRGDPRDPSRSFDARPTVVCVRFGYVDGGRASSSRSYRLHPTDWLAASSPVTDLDYCLLRLAEAA